MGTKSILGIEAPSPLVRKGSRPLSIIKESSDDDSSFESRGRNSVAEIVEFYDQNFQNSDVAREFPVKYSSEKLNRHDDAQEKEREVPNTEVASPAQSRRGTPTRRKAVAPLQHPVLQLSNDTPSPLGQISSMQSQVSSSPSTPSSPGHFATLDHGPVLCKAAVHPAYSSDDISRSKQFVIDSRKEIQSFSSHSSIENQKSGEFSLGGNKHLENGEKFSSKHTSAVRPDDDQEVDSQSFINEQFEDAECDNSSDPNEKTVPIFPSNVLEDSSNISGDGHNEISDNQKGNNYYENSCWLEQNTKASRPVFLRNQIHNISFLSSFHDKPDRDKRDKVNFYISSDPNSPDVPDMSEPHRYLTSSILSGHKPHVERSFDSEQLKWREKVRESASFTCLADKFRPLRRSMSNDDTFGDRLKREKVLEESSAENSSSVSSASSSIQKPNPYSSTPNYSALYSNGSRASSLLNPNRKLSFQGQLNAQNIEIYKRRYSLSKEHSHIKFGHDSAFSNNQNSSLNQSGISESGQLQSQNSEQLSSSSLGYTSLPIRRISSVDQSDLTLVKATTARLNLPTRRPSTAMWREQNLENQAFLSRLREGSRSLGQDIKGDSRGDLTPDLKSRIDNSLSYLRQELIAIRLQDQALAKQFLNIRHTMNKMRLAVECEGHQELLNDAEEEMHDLRELSRLVDIPPELLAPFEPLKHLGITKMNINSRRFSTC